jgi:RecA/RadA recombinase
LPKKAQSENTTTNEENNVLEEKTGQGVDSLVSSNSDTKKEKGRGAYWISSGSDLMDEVVGGGRGSGYETGMSILFEANSSAGKSFLAHEVIASAYHRYKDKCKWLYLDCESGCTFDSKALYGVEIMPPNVSERKRPSTIEDCFAEIKLFGESKKDDEFGIVVIDSIDGLTSEDTETRSEERVKQYSKGKDFDKGSYGMAKAKFLSQEFFPLLNEMVERKNILLIIVAQYRQAAGQYGPKTTISNGDAIKFYPHARVKFTKKEEIEVKGRSVGAVIEVQTIKMKGPRPYRSCYITMHYTRGIDNVTTNIDYLYDLRTAERGELKKAAETNLLDWDGNMLTRQQLIRYIEDNNLERELRKRVSLRWEEEEAIAGKLLEGRKNRYA